MESKKLFLNIIDEICTEEGIAQDRMSYDWIRTLRKNDEIHYIIGYQMDLNSANACEIANDKFATYSVLKKYNIPIIEHKIIFNPKTRSHFYKEQFIEDAEELLKNNNNKIVIKANDSCKGKDVYLCYNKLELREIVNKLFNENKDTLSACPYVDIDYEYRAVVLKGEVIFIYKKSKPYVVGNGKNNLRELIDIKNKDENVKIDVLENLDLNYIPKQDEKKIVSWKHNLNNGANAILIDEKEENIMKIKNIAINAAKAIKIDFASVDIALTEKKELFVMEINGSVCMNKFSEKVENGHNIAKEIYKKAIDKMFE